MLIRRYSPLLTAVLLHACILFSAVSAQAGPPLATDDAGTVDVGRAEVELNGSYRSVRQNIGAGSSTTSTSDAELKLTTGLCRHLGISVAIPYTISERTRIDDRLAGTSEGFGDMTVELKYTFAELAGVNFTVKPAIIVPTGRYSAGRSEGRWQVGGTLIATREFADGTYALHANLGYEHHNYRSQYVIDTTRSDFWSGSIAGEAAVLKSLIAVADVGLATAADKATQRLSSYALTGLRYEINDHLTASAGIRFDFTTADEDLTALYGVLFKF